MVAIKPDLERQLRRQALWLRESWLWLLDQKVLRPVRPKEKLAALDVGCGPGFVMQVLGDVLEVKGLDIDPGMVDACNQKGLDVTLGVAEQLPFEDDSFDLVYCSFLLLWLKDPEVALREMKRVSRRWVICLAEPDYGGRLDYPEELEEIADIVTRGVRAEGGDPFIGRKLRSVFSRCGMEADIGVHPGIWGLHKLKVESEDEWRFIGMSAGAEAALEEVERAKNAWNKALEDGTLFQFNPIFYAFAKKR